ncbi:MAG: hypothetical protein Q8N58_02310 [bacterium]|nr:hypothetical protein [bacterium]
MKKTEKKQNKKLKIIILVVIAMIVLAAVVLGIVLGIKLLGKKCEPLTPLALKKFEIAGGVKPIQGDKCEISGESYLLRLIYKDGNSAESAKDGLELATPGDRNDINGLNWILKDGDSSVFWTNEEKLGILVIPGIDDEATIGKQIDKAFKKLK